MRRSVWDAFDNRDPKRPKQTGLDEPPGSSGAEISVERGPKWTLTPRIGT